MEYRVLGRTGIKVSSYSLGTGALGGWGNTNEDECIQMIDEAIAAGINIIDTADVYGSGTSEQIVGKAIKEKRHEVVLATKVGMPMGNKPNQSGSSRLWIKQAVENSLRRLNTDYIDLYQIHIPDMNTDIAETLGVLTDLVHEGKIRYIGTSRFQAWQLVESLWVSQAQHLERFVSEQPPYSILNRSIELDVLETTRKYGLGVMVWSPLSGGLLTGKYSKGKTADPDSRAERLKQHTLGMKVDPERKENFAKFEAIDRLQHVADEAGMTLAHMAMAFTQTHPSVTASIIGPRTLEQFHETMRGADVRLTADILDEIDKIVPPGALVDASDRALEPAWLEAAARRR